TVTAGDLLMATSSVDAGTVSDTQSAAVDQSPDVPVIQDCDVMAWLPQTGLRRPRQSRRFETCASADIPLANRLAPSVLERTLACGSRGFGFCAVTCSQMPVQPQVKKIAVRKKAHRGRQLCCTMSSDRRAAPSPAAQREIGGF